MLEPLWTNPWFLTHLRLIHGNLSVAGESETVLSWRITPTAAPVEDDKHLRENEGMSIVSRFGHPKIVSYNDMDDCSDVICLLSLRLRIWVPRSHLSFTQICLSLLP